MLMMACKTCGGFPAQVGDALLSCCYLATIRGLNVATAEASPDMFRGLWRWTAKYREAKRAEHAATKAAFARRVRK